MYCIGKQQPLSFEYLTIQIILPGKKKNLYFPALIEMVDANEKELIKALAKEEMRYARSCGRVESSETIVLNTIRIERSKVVSLLKELAASGKLYFEEKKLYCNFFSPVEFFYEGKNNVHAQFEISGHLSLENEVMPIIACDLIFLGPPHWFIFKNTLRFIKGEMAPRWISQVIKGPCTLDARKQETLLDECNEGDFSVVPRLALSLHTQGSLQAQDSLPVLKLTDRLGSFATLWMDYGDQRVIDVLEEPLAYRNTTCEKGYEKDLLETDFIYSPRGTSTYYCPLDKVSKSILFLLECGWTVLDVKGRKIIRQTDKTLDFDLQNQQILVKGKYVYEAFDADVQDVIGAFNRREHFVQLNNPGYTGLLEFSASDSKAFESMEVVAMSVRIKRAHFGLLEDFWKECKKSPLLEKIRSCQESLKDGKPLPDLLPAGHFKAELRHYQSLGFQWLCFLEEFGFSGLLADDMGLGKTVQVLAFLSRIKGPVLIVLPTTLVFHWKREIERFLENTPIYLHQGDARFTDIESFNACSIVITTYAILRIDQLLLSKVFFHIVILDEAQNIKNPDTQTAKAAFSLQAHCKLSLTGTPVENHLRDLWSQFYFLMPGLLPDRKEFEILDPSHLKHIKQMIKPFFLRRKKMEVAKDLPERQEQVVWVEMEPLQKEMYETFLANIRSGLLKKIAVDGIKEHRMEVFEAILRLRQICSHPSLVVSHEYEGGIVGGGKWSALLEDIATVCDEGAKVLVYSQFTAFLKILLKEMQVQKRGVLYLDGATKNREELVTRFQEDPEMQVFLISLKAGGVGLNLTAADYVFLYDPWWNESVENQAIDRAHRIGRKEKVIAKRYVTVESVEEKIMKLKAHKKSLIQEILEDGSEKDKLTEEEWLDLLTSL